MPKRCRQIDITPGGNKLWERRKWGRGGGPTDNSLEGTAELTKWCSETLLLNGRRVVQTETGAYAEANGAFQKSAEGPCDWRRWGREGRGEKSWTFSTLAPVGPALPTSTGVVSIDCLPPLRGCGEGVTGRFLLKFLSLCVSSFCILEPLKRLESL